MLNTRIQRLRDQLDESKQDALLITNPENRRYMSGFTGSSGHILISRDRAVLATDFRYIEQAQAQSPDFEIIHIERAWHWLLDIASEMKLQTVGFEGTTMTVNSLKHLVELNKNQPSNTQVSFLPTEGVIEQLRSIKDSQELEALQRAIDISDKAMENITPSIQVGQTEKEVAWKLEREMRELGADSMSFEIIVATGSNGAMPHHRPTTQILKPGDPLVIDMGAKFDGYCSDITRTICVGETDERFQNIYNLVLGAQLTAIATIKPEMTGEEGDGLARQVLDRAGYQGYFGHSLGHGIGLEVHEHPGLGPRSPNVLKEGMVFSVEPGIYLSGWGGVRIEDLVVLESGGTRALSKARK
jgi:Xaa-Pro aminopeptidase